MGSHAAALAHYVAEHPGRVFLSAVCDLDQAKAEAAREQFGFARRYTSLAALLENEPFDALVMVLPIPAIVPTVVPLLDRPLTAMIEKPLGQDISEARALAAAVEGSSSSLMVSLNRRFELALNRALEWVRGAGPMRAVHGTMLRNARTEADFVWGTGIHLIDTLCHVAGDLSLVSAAAVPGTGDRDAWRTARLTAPGGTVVTLEIQPTAGRDEDWIRIVGDDYCVDVRQCMFHSGGFEAYRKGEQVVTDATPADLPRFIAGGCYGETCAFLDAVADGAPLPGPSVGDALRSAELAAQIQEAR